MLWVVATFRALCALFYCCLAIINFLGSLRGLVSDFLDRDEDLLVERAASLKTRVDKSSNIDTDTEDPGVDQFLLSA